MQLRQGTRSDLSQLCITKLSESGGMTFMVKYCFDSPTTSYSCELEPTMMKPSTCTAMNTLRARSARYSWKSRDASLSDRSVPFSHITPCRCFCRDLHVAPCTPVHETTINGEVLQQGPGMRLSKAAPSDVANCLTTQRALTKLFWRVQECDCRRLRPVMLQTVSPHNAL